MAVANHSDEERPTERPIERPRRRRASRGSRRPGRRGIILLGLAVTASAALAVGALLAGGGTQHLKRASATSPAASGAHYMFRTLNNNNDTTFNQLLGINNDGVIAGYFGSGDQGHPNMGYILRPPYGQQDYRDENFPGSTRLSQFLGPA
jgi:hypothetical protein